MTDPSRLSPQQWQIPGNQAVEFQKQVMAMAQPSKGIAQEKGQGQERVNFFPELFRLAADQIEKDVNEFCDRAATVFDEIDAYGQEPELDDDWLGELTGLNDNFYFSTDSLVSELPPLPTQKRGRKPKSPDEAKVIEAVQQAIALAEAEDVLMIAHQENPSDWIQKIAIALKEKGGISNFGMLRKDTGLSPGALFLGLLLGQERWSLSQETFYGQVTVGLRT